jgi:predicted DNA-binding transcriptional regulator AlpA
MNNMLSTTHKHSGKEVAAAIGIHESTYSTWVRKIPSFPQPIRINQRIQLHDLDAVLRFLRERSKQLGGA